MLNNNQLISVQLVAQGKTGKFISGHLNVAEMGLHIPLFYYQINYIKFKSKFFVI